jgi:hypothetical protein
MAASPNITLLNNFSNNTKFNIFTNVINRNEENNNQFDDQLDEISSRIDDILTAISNINTGNGGNTGGGNTTGNIEIELSNLDFSDINSQLTNLETLFHEISNNYIDKNNITTISGDLLIHGKLTTNNIEFNN